MLFNRISSSSEALGCPLVHLVAIPNHAVAHTEPGECKLDWNRKDRRGINYRLLKTLGIEQ